MGTYYDDEEVKPKKAPKKVYMIINDEKHYIDPEIVNAKAGQSYSVLSSKK